MLVVVVGGYMFVTRTTTMGAQTIPAAEIISASELFKRPDLVPLYTKVNASELSNDKFGYDEAAYSLKELGLINVLHDVRPTTKKELIGFYCDGCGKTYRDYTVYSHDIDIALTDPELQRLAIALPDFDTYEDSVNPLIGMRASNLETTKVANGDHNNFQAGGLIAIPIAQLALAKISAVNMRGENEAVVDFTFTYEPTKLGRALLTKDKSYDKFGGHETSASALLRKDKEAAAQWRVVSFSTKSSTESPKGFAPVPTRQQVAASRVTSDLVQAAGRGFTSEVQKLLAAGADVNGLDGPNTALVKAAWRGHADTVKVLLAAGANPNLKDAQYGGTPLWFTTMDCVGAATANALIAGGADVNLRSNDGLTADEHAQGGQVVRTSSKRFRPRAPVNIKDPNRINHQATKARKIAD